MLEDEWSGLCRPRDRQDYWIWALQAGANKKRERFVSLAMVVGLMYAGESAAEREVVDEVKVVEEVNY